MFIGAIHESPAVETLITLRQTIQPDTIVAEIAEYFFKSPQLEALALVELGEPVGLITRAKLFLSLSRRFGFELYGKKPIIKIADTEPLIIQEGERLESTIDKALLRSQNDIYDEIVVVDDKGCYKGLLSMKQMVIQQSHILANSIVQRELVQERAKELEKINAVKSQFITNVTHELRSPINAIIGLAELMKIACEKGYVHQMRDRLNLLMSSATNLRAIITNILDLSKIEAGKMEVFPEKFDLTTLIREVAETTRVLLGRKSVEVEVIAHEGPLYILSDIIMVRQILINLASNASKFTDSGRIGFALSETAYTLNIAVTDTGRGMRAEEISKVFVAFEQLEDAKTKRHEGTGLGLTITKNLVNLLGGTISVTSTFGTGTKFEVVLPRELHQFAS
ncbi:MAG: sensor histidine kinase [Nitrospirota bacterium]